MKHDAAGNLLVLGEVLAVAYDGLSVAPGRSVVAPGSIVAWDDCCDGQLAVRVIGATPVYQSGGAGCLLGYDLQLGVSIIRCVSTVNDSGQAPSPTQITADGHATARDLRELARALECWRPEDSGVMAHRLGQWTPRGPDGGCAGGEWTLTLRTDAAL